MAGHDQIYYDPNELVIRQDACPNLKLKNYDPNRETPIILLVDNDGIKYVADGNNRAKLAKEQNRQILGTVVDDNFLLGPQTAIDRVLGIFFRRKEG